MSFRDCFCKRPTLLMEGALGERLKREYNLVFDDTVAMANIIYREGGKEALTTLWKEYMASAHTYKHPFLAITPTRRANKERVAKAGYDEIIIKDNVLLLQQLKQTANVEMYIGGLMGCKGDAYKATEILQIDEAKSFHLWQAKAFLEAGVDFLYAGIMPALSEAIGMAQAMEQTQLPYIISFMIRDNGCLIDGTTVHDAIKAIDEHTQFSPVCYMVNCVHPNILYRALKREFNMTELVRTRLQGIQANACELSPEELDFCMDLKSSNSIELAEATVRLTEKIKLKIIGGCCGTDKSHIDSLAKAFSRA